MANLRYCDKQFWQTATVRTIANGTQQIVASIDNKAYTITEASVRSQLNLADATGAAQDQGEGSAIPAGSQNPLDPVPSTSQLPIPTTNEPLQQPSPPSAILALVKKVKSLEVALKRNTKKVVVSSSEDEETEAQGRKIQELDNDPLVSLVKDLVTPIKATVSTQGEEQVEDISPTTLEAAKTLSKVVSQKTKSVDK
ncbi:hypothetical protein Tco_0075115, partial [Tanacetum coccineum]